MLRILGRRSGLIGQDSVNTTRGSPILQDFTGFLDLVQDFSPDGRWFLLLLSGSLEIPSGS